MITDLGKRAKTVVRERLDDLGGPASDYADYAGERIETAQQYLVDRINEKPVPAAMAALGLGVVIGFILAGRSR